MSDDNEQGLSPPEVAAFLRAHPHFLQEHPDVLGDLTLCLGAGATVSSLLERQVLTLRERLRAVDQRQALMLRHAQENEAIQAKLMQLVRGLLRSPQAQDRTHLLITLLKAEFSLTLAELIQPCLDSSSSDGLADLLASSRPSCWSAQCEQGRLILAQLAHLAQPAQGLGSLALLPLQPDRAGAQPRALVLAASDPGRFEAGQGVVFLERIAEIASAALHVPSA